MEEYLRVLQRYGKRKEDDEYEYSLDNALALAAGRLPLVVVLQEPYNTADSVPYDTMVYEDESVEEWGPERIGSATLQELEDLIERASRHKYGLEDVSIFDLNTLLSQDIQDDVGDR